jgi:RNA polymerase sporulation-specific sigma factor
LENRSKASNASLKKVSQKAGKNKALAEIISASASRKGNRDRQSSNRMNSGGARYMLTTWMILMLNGLFFSLRVGNTGSFPRPLKAEEERMYLERAAEGDLEARNKLIEHNLRLVAHIIKNGYSKRKGSQSHRR